MKLKAIIIVIISLLIISSITASILGFERNILIIKSKIIESSISELNGQAPKGTYPLILLNGFDPTHTKTLSEKHMKSLQKQLVEEMEYSDKKILTKETTCAELQYSNKPIVIRVTYFNAFEVEDIKDYADNLDKQVNKILECTGAEKVDIIAHSMGGVVSRYYIKNSNENKVRKLIMLGTPNNGGLYGLASLTDLLIKDNSSIINLDFTQLSENNEFIQLLNKENWEKDTEVEYYTIAGNKDEKGDGVVLLESVKIPESTHSVVPCGHLQINNPSSCPESFEIIKEYLISSPSKTPTNKT